MVDDVLSQGGHQRASLRRDVWLGPESQVAGSSELDKYCGQRPPGRSGASQKGHV